MGTSFAASLITAALGIGGGALLLAVMASLVPAAALIPVHGAVQLASNAGRMGLLLGHVHWPALKGFTLGSLLGAVLGGLVVVELPAWIIQLAVGLFVIWSVFARPPAWLPRFPVLTGGISSFLTMFFGATGLFVAGYTKAQNLPRHGHVATHAALMTVQHSLKVVVFGILGFAFGAWALGGDSVGSCGIVRHADRTDRAWPDERPRLSPRARRAPGTHRLAPDLVGLDRLGALELRHAPYGRGRSRVEIRRGVLPFAQVVDHSPKARFGCRQTTSNQSRHDGRTARYSVQVPRRSARVGRPAMQATRIPRSAATCPRTRPRCPSHRHTGCRRPRRPWRSHGRRAAGTWYRQCPSGRRVSQAARRGIAGASNPPSHRPTESAEGSRPHHQSDRCENIHVLGALWRQVAFFGYAKSHVRTSSRQ